MELYVGGCFQGKQRYVCEKKQIKKEEFMDEAVFGHCKTETEWVEYCSKYKGINHVHLLIRQLLEQGINSKIFLEKVVEKNPDIILICDEVGYGIVPLKKEDREYREVVGRTICMAAQKANHMERIIGGIGMVLKE